MNDGQGNLLPALPQGVLCCLCVLKLQVGTVTALWQAQSFNTAFALCRTCTLRPNASQIQLHRILIAACDNLEKVSYQAKLELMNRIT